jgi:glutathione S-transferase
MQTGRHKGLQTIPQVVDLAVAKFNEKLDVYDKILGKQKYMGGDEFSLVDIFCLPYTQKLFQIGDGQLIESRPNVKAWWERVSTRESWKNVLAATTF